MGSKEIALPFGLALLGLESALKQPQCAVCRLVRETEEKYIWGLLYEFTGDPFIRQELNKALGFCHYHAHLTAHIVREQHLVTPSGVARIYETVVQCYRDRLSGDGRVGKKYRATRRAERYNETLVPHHCKVCAISKNDEAAELNALAEFLRHPPYQDVYKKSDGLCNPHFAQLLIKTKNGKAGNGVYDFLRADQIQRMEHLEKKLCELQRKQSYDVHEAVTKDEAQSWQEAIWRFTGASWSELLIRE